MLFFPERKNQTNILISGTAISTERRQELLSFLL